MVVDGEVGKLSNRSRGRDHFVVIQSEVASLRLVVRTGKLHPETIEVVRGGGWRVLVCLRAGGSD